MIHTLLQTMNDDNAEIWICPNCFSYKEQREGQLDQEEALNCLGIDSEEIPDFNNISDDDLTKEIVRLYERDFNFKWGDDDEA